MQQVFFFIFYIIYYDITHVRYCFEDFNSKLWKNDNIINVFFSENNVFK